VKEMKNNWYKQLAGLEIILVFIGLPILYKFNLIPFHKSIPLLAVFLVYLIVLLRDKSFPNKRFGLNGFKAWLPLLLRFLLVAMVFGGAVLVLKREAFFIIPRENMKLWFLILFFYPLWSAFPQEIIYRAYFFHRFGRFFKQEWIMILVNAVLFSFSHIIFGNWIALVLTFLGSILFSFTYLKSQSLLVVFIEHALYGNLIFTIGLGEYFYLPMGG
jgi:membrane protease YdiL (CAAX protease family)